MKLDLSHATSVLEAGIEHKMFSGPVPEGAGNAITAAGELVELALQARVVADQIGRDNVPSWPALRLVLEAAGIDPDASTAPPLAVEPDDAPSSPPTSGLPAVGQRWLDAEGAAWDVVEYDGGSQMQARLVLTGETAVLPTGFLVERSTQEDASPPPVTPGPERRLCAGNDTVYELESVDGATAFVLDPTGARMSIALEHWVAWPVQESTSVVAPEQSSLPPAAEVVPPPAPESAPSLDAPDRRLQFRVGENRLSASDGNAYVLKVVHPNGTVTVTDIYGESEVTGASSDWMSWVLLDSVGTQEPPAARTEPDAAVAETPAAEEEAKPRARRSRRKKDDPEQTPAEPARHADQQVVVPEDEDEGDDAYADLLARVRDLYTPAAMPAPMDLEHPPTAIPDDLTQVDDIEARRLHSQFNALASRARYLYGWEAAKGRACDRLYRHHLKHAMREARSTLGREWSVTEVQQHAEDVSVVADWMRRRDGHSEAAEAYKTFLAIYSESVTVLSRDWTLRAREMIGS